MRQRWIGGPGVIVCMLCGCAGGATAPKPPPPPGAPVEAARVAAPESAAAPTARPSGLAMWLRVSAPARDLPVLGLVMPVEPTIQALLAKPDFAVSTGLGFALAGLVDLTRPVDFVIPKLPGRKVDGERVAFAFTLAASAAPEEALEGSFSLHPTGRGGLALVPGDDAGGVVGTKIVCELWPPGAPGARGRLVCASDAEVLRGQGPYLARGLSEVQTQAAMRAEMNVAAFRDLLPQADRSRSAKELDAYKAGEQLGERWALDILDDWETAALEVSFGRGRVELAFEQAFRSRRSVVTLLGCAEPDAPMAAPPALFRMPADADMAFFFQGASKEEMKTRGPALFREFFQAMPTSELLPSARDEMASAFSSVLLTGGPLVVAHGRDRQIARTAIEKYLATKPPSAGKTPAADTGLEDARRKAGGWTLFYADEPPETWRRGLREMMRVATKHYEAETQPAASGEPTPPAQRRPSMELTKMGEVRIAPSDGLPAGSLHLVLSTAPNPKYVQRNGADKPPTVPHEDHLWLAPEGAATWLAWSEEPRLARDKLRQVLGGSATAAAAARAELEPLRAARGAGAGIMTLAGAMSLFLPNGSRGDLEEARRQLARLDALPGRGESAVPVLWTTTSLRGPDGSRGCRARISASLDKQALGGVLALFRERQPQKTP